MRAIDVRAATTPYVTDALNKVLTAVNALSTQNSDLRIPACARKGTIWMKIAVLSALALLKAATQMVLSLNVARIPNLTLLPTLASVK